jgi:hypothetical protein
MSINSDDGSGFMGGVDGVDIGDGVVEVALAAVMREILPFEAIDSFANSDSRSSRLSLQKR